MKNRLFILLVAAMMVLGLSSNVFAAAQAMDAFTDVPTIPRAACDKAGTYGLKAGDTWKMHENDIINFTLTNNVTLCKSVDYFMVVMDAQSNAGAANFQLSQNSTYPVYSNDPVVGDLRLSLTGTALTSLLGGLNPPAGTRLVLGFQITGSSGGNQVTMQLRRLNRVDGSFPLVGAGADAQDWVMTLTDASPATTNQMNVTLFDYKNNMYYNNTGIPGFLKKNTAAPYGYDTDTVAEDNVLCVNTANFTGDYVELSPVSSPANGDVQYRMSFTGTYRIAQVTGSAGFTIAEVGKVACPDISTYATPDQLGVTTKPYEFDVGTYTTPGNCTNGRWTTGSPVCGQTYQGHGLLITSTNYFALGDQYKIQMTLAVKGATATDYTTSQSNYWFLSGGAAGYWTTGTYAGNTACTSSAVTTNLSATMGTVGTSSFTYTKSGATSTGYKTLAHANYETIIAAQTSKNAIMIDIPTVTFNPDAVQDGETAGLYVEVIKYPCLVVKTGYICLGKIKSTQCTTTGGSSCTSACTHNFPYGIDPANASWWSGVALTNQCSTAGTATLTMTDTDGGTVTFTKALAANKIEIIAFNSAWYSALTAGHTLANNKPWRLTVSSTTTVDGILMIGDNAGTYGIHGYQPRNTCYVSAP